jgi:serine/threonine protein kinase
MQLQLAKEWLLGERIDGGGFGQVYAAKSADYDSAAVVKLVPKAPGAERELLFADLTGVRNVVPIIDQGETEDSWVLVMSQADKSLRQHLAKVTGPLAIAEAVTVLSDIATALTDLEGRRIVHRDLKPENVLLLHGRGMAPEELCHGRSDLLRVRKRESAAGSAWSAAFESLRQSVPSAGRGSDRPLWMNRCAPEILHEAERASNGYSVAHSGSAPAVTVSRP